MDEEISRKTLRKIVEANIKEAIPDHPELRMKELDIFDHIMTRRDFFKTSAVAAATILLYDGCMPSQSSGNDIDEKEKEKVAKASKILVDSDIMDGLQHYDPLKAAGSKDAPAVTNGAVLESFNPHVMTVASDETFTKSGFNPLSRSYGIPEYIHLNRDSADSDYYLAIYEKNAAGHHGLKETTITLEGTASFKIDSLVAANGNFHNRTLGQKAYSQKMLLLSNTENTVNPALRLYYQAGSSPLLMPGAAPEPNDTWLYIDLFERFDRYESHTFSKRAVLEVNAYHDGSSHGFVYGTIQFDSLYNYGFIATFNSITDTEPAVTFFAPEFLSVKSETIRKLNENFDSAMEDAGVTSDSTFTDFSLFSNQKFIPFSQLKNTVGNTQSQVLFSFLCFDSASDPEGSEADVDGDEVDLDHFCNTDSSLNKRYLVSVDTYAGGVVYPLAGYGITPSITVDDDTFILDFDTSAIPTIDIWKSVYNPQGDRNGQATVQFENTFVRSIQNDGSRLHIILATSFYDGNDIGVTHKSVKIDYDPSGGILQNFTLGELSGVDSTFETALHGDKGYKELWFDEMKADGTYAKLADYVHHNNGVFDFYCTHTHQGLLRSYYVIHITDGHSFLIGFDEQGANPDGTDGKPYDYQTAETLYRDIVSDTLKHYPPLPVALNPQRMLRWHNIAQDSEVLYIAPRTYATDEKNKTLQPNDDAGKLSYFHASSDPLEGIWTTHEQQKQVPPSESLRYQYKVTSHQVHLHVNNIYDYPVVLPDGTYVELRFSKPLVVTDHTDVGNPVTYHVGRLSSLFLKPDGSGRIALDIKAGANENDLFKGATMMYRFLDASDLKLRPDEPVAVLSSGSAGATTEFRQCNISFRQFERLSSKEADKPQPGAPAETKTARALFDENVISGQKKTISSFTDAYGTLHKSSRPDNDTPPVRIRAEHVRAEKSAIEPLLYVALLQTNRPGSVDSIWHKVVDWGKKALHTIANVAHSAVHLAEKLARSIKKAVGKLVADIKTIMSEIGASLLDVIVRIGAAFDKILNIIISVAELVWNFIKALFDTDSAWQIGQELKQLFHDQFSPDSNIKGNAYSILKSQVSTFQNDIDGVVKYARNGIDNAIDAALGYQPEDDPVTEANAQAKSDREHSTKYSYLDDQVDRLTASTSVSFTCRNALALPRTDSPAGGDCDSSDDIEKLLRCVASKVSETTVHDVRNIVNDSMKSIEGLIEGKTWEETRKNFGGILKDSAGLILDDMDILLKGAVQLPLAFLNGSALFRILEKALDDTLKPVFELLSLLLLGKKDRFRTLSDVGFFAIGYFINLSGLLLHDVLSTEKTDLNIPEYIKSKEFRNQINALGEDRNGSAAHIRASSVALLPASSEIDRVVRASYKRGCPQNILGKIWNIISPFALSGARIPSFIYHYRTGHSPSVGMAADYTFIYSQYTNAYRLYQAEFEEYDEEMERHTAFLYVSSTIACRILDLIEASEKSANTYEKINLTEKSMTMLQALITTVIEVEILADRKPCTLGNINFILSCAGAALTAVDYIFYRKEENAVLM